VLLLFDLLGAIIVDRLMICSGIVVAIIAEVVAVVVVAVVFFVVMFLLV